MKKRLIKIILLITLFSVVVVIWATKDFRMRGKMHVAFTFDDGTKDHVEFAAPILEKYGYRGMFCIVSERVGKPGYMSWDDVNDLLSRGHDIASHTATHQNLLDLIKQGKSIEVKNEMLRSIKAIEENTNKEILYLAFPYNACNTELFDMLDSINIMAITPERMNLGGEPARDTSNIQMVLKDRASKRYDATVLMFHGIVRQGGGYASFNDVDGATFEKCVKDIYMNDGTDYVVVKYNDYNNWPLPDKYSILWRIENKISDIIRKFFYRPTSSGF